MLSKLQGDDHFASTSTVRLLLGESMIVAVGAYFFLTWWMVDFGCGFTYGRRACLNWILIPTVALVCIRVILGLWSELKLLRTKKTSNENCSRFDSTTFLTSNHHADFQFNQ